MDTLLTAVATLGLTYVALGCAVIIKLMCRELGQGKFKPPKGFWWRLPVGILWGVTAFPVALFCEGWERA